MHAELAAMERNPEHVMLLLDCGATLHGWPWGIDGFEPGYLLFLRDPHQWVQAFASTHHRTPDELRTGPIGSELGPPEPVDGDPVELALKGEGMVQLRAFQDPRLPLAFIVDQSNSNSGWIRAVIAERTDCPPFVLQILASDRSRNVRESVAANRSTPVQWLKRFAADPDPVIRRAVAGNESCPPDVRSELRGDPDRFVRAAAGNPTRFTGTVPEALAKLASSRSIFSHVMAASHPALPRKFVVRLLKSANRFVRLGVARNSALAADERDILLADPDREVRRVAGRLRLVQP